MLLLLLLLLLLCRIVSDRGSSKPSSNIGIHLLLRIDNIHKSGLQARTTDQETINIRLLSQLLAILVTHTSTIDDSRLLCRIGSQLLCNPLPNSLVHLLSLLRRCNFTRSNRPDGLVGDNHFAPILDRVGYGFELSQYHIHGLVAFSLLQRLSTAENDAQSSVECDFGLASHELVRLLENDSAFRMSEDGPGDVAVFELFDGDFSRKGSVGLVKDILGGHFDSGTKVLAGEEEVEGWWSDDYFGGWVDFGSIEVGDNVFDCVDGAVPVR